MNEYKQFLERKKQRVIESGFDAGTLNSSLFDFQQYIVKRALKSGRFAIFADCGLGKTLMQLEWANHVAAKTQMPVLILAPLAVSGQTIMEGERFGIHVEQLNSEVLGPGIYISLCIFSNCFCLC